MPKTTGGGVEAHVKGMGFMVLSMLMLPLMDAIGKWLAMMDDLPPATATFMRFFVQCWLMFFIILVVGGLRALATSHLMGNLLRGALMGFGGLCFFTAVKYMPLADAMAVFFAEPLILTLFSALFLKEKVGWRRFSAVGIGLIGTMIVIQPSFEIFGMVSLLPLATAVTFAIYLILNRKYGAKESPLTMQLYAGLGGWLFVGWQCCSLPIGALTICISPCRTAYSPGCSFCFWAPSVRSVTSSWCRHSSLRPHPCWHRFNIWKL